MLLSLVRSTAPSEWERISVPHQRSYGSSELKESVNFLALPSTALMEQSVKHRWRVPLRSASLFFVFSSIRFLLAVPNAENVGLNVYALFFAVLDNLGDIINLIAPVSAVLC